MMARAVVHDLVRAEDVEEVRVTDLGAARLRTLRDATGWTLGSAGSNVSYGKSTKQWLLMRA
jgi:hypothetical protein